MIEINPTVVTVVISALVAVTAVIGFIWKSSWWLGDQFRSTREVFFRALQEIEDKFDKRHEDNIVRFATLETKIDIAIKNGKH